MPVSPQESSSDLALRLGVAAHVATVVTSQKLSASVHEVVMAGHATSLAGVPGNDVMVRVSSDPAHHVRRRYSVRAVDESRDTFTLWVTTHHEGAGSRWARHAKPGDHVDVVGPRGKISLDPLADWHLFVGDVSALGAFYRMVDSIDAPGRAICIVEIDNAIDALTNAYVGESSVTGIFVNRDQRAPGDATGLLNGLSAFAMPPDAGHAYLFGEFDVIRVLRSALLDRGLAEGEISRKAFWRSGRANADHGEPDKSAD